MRKTFLLLFIGCLFTACSSDDDFNLKADEVIKELTLSVKSGNVYTDGVDFEFDILKGNGEYTVSVSNEEDARVAIDGSKVKINLLKNTAVVTVSDKKKQSASVVINSTAKSLIPTDYSLFISGGDVFTMKDVAFGDGGYTIGKIKGTSADVIVAENDHIKVTGLKPGNSYYKIKDKRGSTAPLEICVISSYDLTDNNIEITAVNDQRVSVVLKRGDGDWKLVGDPLSPVIQKVTLLPKGDIDRKYDVLQIETSKDDAKGIAAIQLKDKSGNSAFITVKVQ